MQLRVDRLRGLIKRATSSRRGKWVIAAGATALVLLALIVSLAPQEKPGVKGHEGVVLAHAQKTDPTSGCAACHTQPISAACTDCHTPPTTIRGISFPHHDPSSWAYQALPGGCQNTVCHDGSTDDVRYVQVVTASHTYCGQCHTLTHSSP